MSKALRTKSIIAISVAVVTFLVFLPALQNDFVNWDDNAYAKKNLFIRSLDAQLLRSAFAEFHEANWHPLTWLSHALDYAMWGLDPLGHHLTNNVFHSLNTLLVVFLAMGLIEAFRKTAEETGPPRPILHVRAIWIAGGATGLLFGLHPLHVESVAWVAERKDLLCAFFFLLSVLAYMSYATHKSYRTYLLALCFFVLALLSKPMAVTLPFVLLILDWHPFGRIRSLKTFRTASIEKLPFLALSLISSIVTILAQKAGGAVKSVETIPLPSRVIVAAKSLVAYLVKMTVPVDLVPFYPYPEKTSLFSLQYGMPIVIVIAITAACIVVARKQRLWPAIWSYYVITLMPVLGIVQVGEQSMADRYAYLPSLGPFLVVGLIAAKVDNKVAAFDQRKMLSSAAVLFIAITLLVSLSSVTIRQIGIWKNSIVFWNYVIDREPVVSLAHNNLGQAYLSSGEFDKAIEQIRIALRLKPDDAGAHTNLGAAYLSKGFFDAAIEEYRIAIGLNPGLAEAQYNLGYAYLSRGQLDMAIEQFQTALRLRPDHADAHNNLGNAYFAEGRFDMAIEQYRIAAGLKPDIAEIHYNLGNAYLSNRLFDMAIEQYRNALRLTPDLAKAHFKLGLSYLYRGSKDMARTEFELELTMNPDNNEARQMLNSILSK